MTDPTGRPSALLVALFSRLASDELPRAYAELLRGFERAANAAEVEQQAQDITGLLWALKTGGVVTAEQVLDMDAELRHALDAARLRLRNQP